MGDGRARPVGPKPEARRAESRDGNRTHKFMFGFGSVTFKVRFGSGSLGVTVRVQFGSVSVKVRFGSGSLNYFGLVKFVCLSSPKNIYLKDTVMTSDV